MFVLSELEGLDYSSITPSLQEDIDKIKRDISKRSESYELYRKLSMKSAYEYEDDGIII